MMSQRMYLFSELATKIAGLAEIIGYKKKTFFFANTLSIYIYNLD